MRSDNAKEYLNNFNKFLEQILYQSSCVYNQQNGVAERKNRHLDIARTMLFHKQVSKEFWGEAILTACYLINRIPSFVLQNKISYPMTPILIRSLCLQRFLSFSTLSIIIILIRQNLIPDLLKDFYWLL